MSQIIQWPSKEPTKPEEHLESTGIESVGPPGADAGAGGGGEDSKLQRIGKMVPAQVTAFYLAAIKLIEGAANTKLSPETLYWVVFGLGLIATPLYIRKLGAGGPWKTQAAVSTVAFLFWSYALKGPWAPIYDALLAGILLLGFSLFSGLISKPVLDRKPA